MESYTNSLANKVTLVVENSSGVDWKIGIEKSSEKPIDVVEAIKLIQRRVMDLHNDQA